MNCDEFSTPLLAWYDASKRILPFRTLSTPYRVWVSEIMLQQTRVSAALPYFERFMEALPTVADLAACPQDRLMKLWEGLGYYSRARNLQKAACILTEQYGGQLPADYDALRSLPGIGDYTAGAIASISFGLPVTAVDGNVLRVFSRLLWDEGDVLKPDTKRRLTAQAAALQPVQRPGDYNQALMELGALICVPNGAPLCGQCPVAHLCRAHQLGRETELPHKTPKAQRRVLDYTVLLILRESSCGRQLLLPRRPQDGLLAGLWQPVLLEGHLTADEAREALLTLGVDARPQTPLRPARHIFSHLEWHMTGYLCRWAAGQFQGESAWADRDSLQTAYALPNAFKTYSAAAKKVL